MRGDEGFSLIEALVALAILAIAAAGLIRASEAHVDAVRGFEQRAAAQWVAENRLAELRLVGAVALKANADKDLCGVAVSVRPAKGAGPTVTLDGFVDVGAGTA